MILLLFERFRRVSLLVSRGFVARSTPIYSTMANTGSILRSSFAEM